MRNYIQVIKKTSTIYFPIISLTLLALMNTATVIYAHPIDLNNISRVEIGRVYLQQGFTHILPAGIDHILFILGVYLLSPNLKTVFIQTTAFTIAHTITLTLSTYDILSVQPMIVEPIISISILFVAVENIFSKSIKAWRIIVIFIFGLIHGLGFASGLKEIGLPGSEYVTALLTFTAGVELGQVSVVLLAYFLIGKWFSAKQWYHQRVVVSLSLLISFIAFYWTVERIWL